MGTREIYVEVCIPLQHAPFVRMPVGASDSMEALDGRVFIVL